MQIIYAVVMSLDGKTTQGDQPNIYTWTSAEDKAYFHTLITQSSLIIMGSKTFAASQEMILQRLTPKTLRVVMARDPEKYQTLAIPGQLEFVHQTPNELVADLESRGYSEALFIGGSELAESFFRSKLITYLYVTIEPIIFGIGKLFILAKSLQHISLKLLHSKQLNEAGTLLLKYEVYNT